MANKDKGRSSKQYYYSPSANHKTNSYKSNYKIPNKNYASSKQQNESTRKESKGLMKMLGIPNLTMEEKKEIALAVLKTYLFKG